MKHWGLWIAAAVVVIANAWLLAGVWWNRVQAGGETVDLTERELRLEHTESDNTAMFLRLRWSYSSEYDPSASGPRTAGFECSGISPRRGHYSIPAYIVLERREFGEGVPHRVDPLSGLAVIDAGPDYGPMRHKHPDPSRYLVLPGAVTRPRTPDDAPRCLRAQVHPDEVFVPPPYCRLLEPLRSRTSWEQLREGGKPRYAVTVRYDSRHQPRVTGVRLLDPGSSPR